jgi:hypothetical protein
VAEEEGFEPPGPFRAQRFSRPPHSATLPLLHVDSTTLIGNLLHRALRTPNGQSVHSRRYDALFAIRSAERPVNQNPLFHSIVTSFTNIEKDGCHCLSRAQGVVHNCLPNERFAIRLCIRKASTQQRPRLRRGYKSQRTLLESLMALGCLGASWNPRHNVARQLRPFFLWSVSGRKSVWLLYWRLD